MIKQLFLCAENTKQKLLEILILLEEIIYFKLIVYYKQNINTARGTNSLL